MTSVWFINTEVISVICGIHHVDRERVEASTRHADWVPDLSGVRGRTDQPDKVSPLSTLIPSTLNPYPYAPPYPAGPGQAGRTTTASLGLFDVRAFDHLMWASVDDLVAVTLELEAPERHLVKLLLTC